MDEEFIAIFNCFKGNSNLQKLDVSQVSVFFEQGTWKIECFAVRSRRLWESTVTHVLKTINASKYDPLLHGPQVKLKKSIEQAL